MATAAATSTSSSIVPANNNIAFALHGGAGTLSRAELTPALEEQYRAVLNQALDAGYSVLQRGDSSVLAVEAAINIMEDSPLFNAGKGAVFNHDGVNELDASIMDGATLRAGAVAGLQHVKNPVSLARLVMEHSEHVLLIGVGAEHFAQEQGVTLVDTQYFRTEWRWQQLQKQLNAKQGTTQLSENSENMATLQNDLLRANANKFGTVGAVALDKHGHLAAATSTGGMTNKRWGRVGDSPIIGAGTYANAFCAVSGTGHGEYFIRASVAHDICARVEYQKKSVQQAAHEVVMERLKAMGGDGGVVAMDVQGNLTMPFNTSGMYRAAIDVHGVRQIKIFAE